jgi:hypothetical protein
MPDGYSNRLPKPRRRSVRWTSFVAAQTRGPKVRALEEEGNSAHRVRVEHNRDTLLIHVSAEDGRGWTSIALDQKTREWVVAQRPSQRRSAERAFCSLYG